MPDTELENIIARSVSDPGVRHTAVKDAYKLAKQFLAFILAAEPLAKAADLDAAHRQAQSRIDALNAEAAAIPDRIAMETAEERHRVTTELDRLRAEATDLDVRVTNAQCREKALRASLALIEDNIRTAQTRLDELTSREALMRPVVEEADRAEGRLSRAEASLAQIEARRAELLKSLGAS
jgi:chromosome segregation ATPase